MSLVIPTLAISALLLSLIAAKLALSLQKAHRRLEELANEQSLII